MRGFGGVSRMVQIAKHKVRFIDLNFKIIMRIVVVELHCGH
jgi:hypothetical protein